MRLSPNHPPKPKNTASHHIVALTDPRAERALRILVKWGIDFNDEANGVNLPRYKKHVPHDSIPMPLHIVKYIQKYIMKIYLLF